MPFGEITHSYKSAFNTLASHPLQSWEWGEFRKKTGIKVLRIGAFTNNTLIETLQMTLHPLPFGLGTIGYVPKSHIPSIELLTELLKTAKRYSCIFIKFEPNIQASVEAYEQVEQLHLHISPHPLFTRFTFQVDLTVSEEQLLRNLSQKTRYNIKVAQKNGVVIREENSKEAFQAYLDLTFQTAKRQRFFAHNRNYHEKMWGTLSKTGIAHLLTSRYKREGGTKILAAWILFNFHNTMYYPYGSSSAEHRNTMASNLLMWEAIRFGKRNGAKVFDMWGSLGPDPDPKDPWYGFHRFKMGYSPKLIEYVGSFDAVINKRAYNIYNTLHIIRQKFLSLKRLLI